jgi:lipoprotein-anchoring transpeptidase ErfK/SrfK
LRDNHWGRAPRNTDPPRLLHCPSDAAVFSIFSAVMELRKPKGLVRSVTYRKPARGIMKRWIIALELTALLQLPAAASELKPDVINAATFTGKLSSEDRNNPLAVKIQVLLDRARFSPGEIDGRFGDNVEKALRAFAEANSLPSGKVLTPEIWSKLQQGSGDPVIVEYVLTDQDVKGPFIDKLPAKLEDKKSLKRLNYTSSKEALGEHFHMSEDLLAEINPGKKFDRVGDKINVAGLSADKQSSKVSRIEVDKGRETVRTLAQDGTLVAFYPASVGSEEKPTPSGTLKVVSIQSNPTYRYDPKYKFKGVESTKPFTINAGPNNPVGTMWIGLSENGYGIHGTAEPSRVSKSESHGCVRMTNWDVERLATSVRKGVEVNFVEGKQASR